MSASFRRGGWEVCWRDASGRRRARRFPSEEAARAFDEALSEVSPAARRTDTARHGRSGGVYSYRTSDGVRWRFVYRRSDGTQTTKRGFASGRAALDARRRLVEQVEPVVFNFHGYPWLIHRLTYRRTNHANLHVRGSKEERTTTTPFDMAVRNQIDRFGLVCDVIDQVPKLGSSAAHARQAMGDKLIEQRKHVPPRRGSARGERLDMVAMSGGTPTNRRDPMNEHARR